MALKEQKEKASGLVDRAKATVAALRARWPLVDHLVRTLLHYSHVQGNVLAGAVTFFGFLSFFPILALAFAVVAYVAVVYPDAEEALVEGISKVLPGLIGPGEGQISIEAFKSAGGAAGAIGLVGLLYSGLGWLSGMRQALQAAFVLDQSDQRNFFVGKGVDLLVLALIGLTLVLSVSVSGVITGFSAALFELVGIAESPAVKALLWVLSFVVGIAASVVLFFVMYRLLPAPDLPTSSLVKGAILAALLFELLKRLAFLLFAQAADSPGAAVLGIALVLVIWINYFSRVVMLGAAWAYTTPEAIAEQEAEELMESTEIQYVAVAGARPLAQARLEARRQRRVDRISLASGVAIGAVSGALAGMLRRRG
ncbi:MAG TPA: YihY/virulence factor BrkB family protein [Nocardioidaceae bacterium]|nr:YihY/virulence factor BrkB family protein [Nocardioidaceae bacterium]